MKQAKLDVDSVSETSPMALLLIDVINRLDFEGAEKMLGSALSMARRIASLKRRAKAKGIPVIYVNDNFGRWKSDFKMIVGQCLSADAPGRRLGQLLKPEEDDYFVLKPRHSAFFGTPLAILLEYLRVRTVIITGIAGNSCVLFTAHDAFLRNFHVVLPSDCIVSETKQENSSALRQMKKVLKAVTKGSKHIRFSELLRHAKGIQSK